MHARAQAATPQSGNERLQSHTLKPSKRTSAPITGQATALAEITTAQPALEPVPLTSVNDNICQSGLNGLTAGGVEGLDTVRKFACSRHCSHKLLIILLKAIRLIISSRFVVISNAQHVKVTAGLFPCGSAAASPLYCSRILESTVPRQPGELASLRIMHRMCYMTF